MSGWRAVCVVDVSRSVGWIEKRGTKRLAVPILHCLCTSELLHTQEMSKAPEAAAMLILVLSRLCVIVRCRAGWVQVHGFSRRSRSQIALGHGNGFRSRGE